jgi:hypothetical protein
MSKKSSLMSFSQIQIRENSKPDIRIWLTIGLLLIMPAIALAQCNLIITNPSPACFTVDITNPSVTAGSDAGLTLTYWTNSDATTPLANPSAITNGGIYYIRAVSENGCINIKPVTVIINITQPEFGSFGPYCLATKPSSLPTVSRNGITGTWNPAIISTSFAGTTIYTFTPDNGQCATVGSVSVTTTGPDVSAPVIIHPANVTINCEDPITPASLGSATATDDCDSNVSIIYVDNIKPGSCPQNYTILRTWTATDESGNSSSTIQNITVQDITPPVMQGIPSNVTVDCNAIPDPPYVTAVDNCSASPLIQYTTLINTVENCRGSIVRVWATIDECGNASTAQQTITVIPSTVINNQLNQQSIQIYPNPNNGTFNFDYQPVKISTTRLSIIDMTGRIVWEKTFPAGSANTERITLPVGSRGIFYLQLVSDSGLTYRKIMVE